MNNAHVRPRLFERVYSVGTTYIDWSFSCLIGERFAFLCLSHFWGFAICKIPDGEFSFVHSYMRKSISAFIPTRAAL